MIFSAKILGVGSGFESCYNLHRHTIFKWCE